jgi:hypothetical protein
VVNPFRFRRSLPFKKSLETGEIERPRR